MFHYLTLHVLFNKNYYSLNFKTMKTLMISLLVITLSTHALQAQTFTADVKNSTLKWHGKKVTGEHFGHINLKKGTIEIADDRIINGYFIIDMTSITNTDLTDETYNTKLVNHLKSDDFFGAEKHPEAFIEIKEGTPFVDNQSTVEALLTIKNITHPVTFKVNRAGSAYQAEIVVDRSKYDVRYRSGSFFDGLGDKLIYDEFTINVDVEMNKIIDKES